MRASIRSTWLCTAAFAISHFGSRTTTFYARKVTSLESFNISKRVPHTIDHDTVHLASWLSPGVGSRLGEGLIRILIKKVVRWFSDCSQLDSTESRSGLHNAVRWNIMYELNSNCNQKWYGQNYSNVGQLSIFYFCIFPEKTILNKCP